MTTEATPGALGSNGQLGLPAEAALSAHDLALRFETSAAWLLNGQRPAGPLVGAGAYLEAATRLRRHAAEIERMRGALEVAVRQNEHDMLMTGEELRACRAALDAVPPHPPAEWAQRLPDEQQKTGAGCGFPYCGGNSPECIGCGQQ